MVSFAANGHKTAYFWVEATLLPRIADVGAVEFIEIITLPSTGRLPLDLPTTCLDIWPTCPATANAPNFGRKPERVHLHVLVATLRRIRLKWGLQVCSYRMGIELVTSNLTWKRRGIRVASYGAGPFDRQKIYPGWLLIQHRRHNESVRFMSHVTCLRLALRGTFIQPKVVRHTGIQPPWFHSNPRLRAPDSELWYLSPF